RAGARSGHASPRASRSRCQSWGTTSPSSQHSLSAGASSPHELHQPYSLPYSSSRNPSGLLVTVSSAVIVGLLQERQHLLQAVNVAGVSCALFVGPRRPVLGHAPGLRVLLVLLLGHQE